MNITLYGLAKKGSIAYEHTFSLWAASWPHKSGQAVLMAMDRPPRDFSWELGIFGHTIYFNSKGTLHADYDVRRHTQTQVRGAGNGKQQDALLSHLNHRTRELVSQKTGCTQVT